MADAESVPSSAVEPSSASSAGGAAAKAEHDSTLGFNVRREWPQEWDLLPALRGDADAPCLASPPRYLHSAFDISLTDGRGQKLVAKHAMEAGELVLLDTPIATADTFDTLVQVVTTRMRDDEEFRRIMLGMPADPGSEAAQAAMDRAPPPSVIKSILRRHHRDTDTPPIDGELPDGPPLEVGIWPLSSLVSYALRPNAVRICAGRIACYRLIRPVAAGDELRSNFLDPRLPKALRLDALRRRYGAEFDDPVDEADAPAEVLAKIQEAHSAATALSEPGTPEAAKAAFSKLLELTNQCEEAGIEDPAFTDVFRDFGVLAGQLGDASLCLQGLAKAIELVTQREPYNIMSCVFTQRMLHTACLANKTIDDDTRAGLKELAQKHSAAVYGPGPGVFEVLNAKSTRKLAILAEAARRPNAAKRARKQ
eukprot:TRINITY_DN9538_c1_g4_i1.p1 TRINITY_DN9538_c1_g4~~TRINITY_DN9538_c1_g4_i1.p1  ORF type:complete len:424 (-),score=45.02 TRINITY_DN9538_c1_g4_i1:68-1339(-)